MISISQIASYIFRTHKFRFNWKLPFLLVHKTNIFSICLFFIFCRNKKFLTGKIWERPPASPLSQKKWGDKIRKWSIAKSDNIFFRNRKQDFAIWMICYRFSEFIVEKTENIPPQKVWIICVCFNKKIINQTDHSKLEQRNTTWKALHFTFYILFCNFKNVLFHI